MELRLKGPLIISTTIMVSCKGNHCVCPCRHSPYIYNRQSLHVLNTNLTLCILQLFSFNTYYLEILSSQHLFIYLFIFCIIIPRVNVCMTYWSSLWKFIWFLLIDFKDSANLNSTSLNILAHSSFLMSHFYLRHIISQCARWVEDWMCF